MTTLFEQNILHAIKTGDITTVKSLFIGNFDKINQPITDDNEPSLPIAIEFNQPKIVKFLLENGADFNFVNVHQLSCLDIASHFGFYQIVDILLDFGACLPLEPEFKNSLFIAIKEGHIDVVKSLTKGKTNINIKDPKDNIPLHVATGNHESEILQYLINNGADINFQNTYGNTAILLASSNNSNECFSILMNHGADINIPNNDKKTPLFFAIEQNNVFIVENLINHGALINIQDNKGNSPLIVAACNGLVDIFQLLLNAEANVFIKNNDNNTALDLAISYNKSDIIRIINSYLNFNELNASPSFASNSSINKKNKI